jgi:hypothetical protein
VATDNEKLNAYREKMKRGEAAWQKSAPKAKKEPLDFDFLLSEQKTDPLDRVPGLKRVNELQFGDIYRMHEGPDMNKFVQPHQNWRTFVGFKETDHPRTHILSSTHLGHPTDFPYSDILNRRFETMTKEEADKKDIAY